MLLSQNKKINYRVIFIWIFLKLFWQSRRQSYKTMFVKKIGFHLFNVYLTLLCHNQIVVTIEAAYKKQILSF